ncbi:MAG TPA: DUF1778 domain-containing protein [bacterium]|nr:DUF1778 domain-containing protein [bacterium]
MHAPDPGLEAARMDFRLNKAQKQLIERAAAYLGTTVSGFAVSTILREAEAVVERHERIVLNDAQRDAFLRLLDNPPKPNPALRRLARDYQDLVVERE